MLLLFGKLFIKKFLTKVQNLKKKIYEHKNAPSEMIQPIVSWPSFTQDSLRLNSQFLIRGNFLARRFVLSLSLQQFISHLWVVWDFFILLRIYLYIILPIILWATHSFWQKKRVSNRFELTMKGPKVVSQINHKSTK